MQKLYDQFIKEKRFLANLSKFSEDQIKRFFAYKPKTFAQIRLYTMICFAFYTSCRINKILPLRREDVDFENLPVKVCGKSAFPKTNGEIQSYRTELQVFT